MRRAFLLPLALLIVAAPACDDGSATPTMLPFTATIDGETFAMSAAEISATLDTTTGTLQIHASGRDEGPPGVEDAGATLTVDVVVDEAALKAMAPGSQVTFAGTATYADRGIAYDLAAEDIAYAATQGGDVVTAVHSRVHCFCTRYGDAQQAVTGTLTLDSYEGATLRATIEVQLDGWIPFRLNGNETLSATMDIDVTVAGG